MNDEQYKRFRRYKTEALECLYQTRDSKKNLHFLISGSSGTRYKVTIPVDGKVTCSCPDFSHTCKVQECVCKHVLHVIFKTLRLFDDVDHAFFKRCRFTPDEMDRIKTCYRASKQSK